ncbi:PREDICTED: protein FAM166B-like, partial [Priapulus caudatus]|uniref:Protein FAM166B-like n=1 Tax=Priapulus caudatus TaxID=37621 RepID=A0ABM1F6S4_PRICU
MVLCGIHAVALPFYRMPLQVVTKETEPYFSPHAVQHTVSPYYMAQNNPEKFFMSGYTGFIPKARGLMGIGYPVVTNLALLDFQTEMDSHTTNCSRPVIVERQSASPKLTKPVYPTDSGLVPHYTGHIP